MRLNPEPRAYELVVELVTEIGGDMDWRPGGDGGGGTWEIDLHGKVARIPCHDQRINALDGLYVPKVAEPSTWEDYEQQLIPGAFWRLVDLVRERSEGQ